MVETRIRPELPVSGFGSWILNFKNSWCAFGSFFFIYRRHGMLHKICFRLIKVKWNSINLRCGIQLYVDAGILLINACRRMIQNSMSDLLILYVPGRLLVNVVFVCSLL